MDVSHRNDHIEQTIERPEDKRLGAGANLVYGLQHVLTMYGGIVAVPLIRPGDCKPFRRGGAAACPRPGPRP